MYPLKTKDQVFECFKVWQAEVENFTGKRVKVLRTDNDGKFTSKAFEAHLKACGIQHELTIPKRVKVLRTDNSGEFTSKAFEAHHKAYGIRHELTIPKTPEQNGVAERLNRTLVKTTKAMLLDANLPQKFWTEAVSTAAYLRNRSPSSTVGGITPHQAWYGQKPRVDHLRVFGCTAFVHVPKDEREKLDSKTRKCILLGYGGVQKGY